MYVEKYESNLFDNYDNGYCCLVNSSRFDREKEMQNRPREVEWSEDQSFGNDKSRKW